MLTKIDDILVWERRSEAEPDTRFVELGRYLCEVRTGQYWRVEKLKSFDEFLARRFHCYYNQFLTGFSTRPSLTSRITEASLRMGGGLLPRK